MSANGSKTGTYPWVQVAQLALEQLQVVQALSTGTVVFYGQRSAVCLVVVHHSDEAGTDSEHVVVG